MHQVLVFPQDSCTTISLAPLEAFYFRCGESMQTIWLASFVIKSCRNKGSHCHVSFKVATPVPSISMTKSAVALPLDYPRLQGLIRKNASCYVDDFAAQYRNFISAIDLLRTSASSQIDNLEPLIIFLSQTSHYYPQIASAFPTTCYDLLSSDSFVDAVDPLIRKALVQALMQLGSLKNKHCMSQSKVLTLLFRLFRIKDKQLKELLLSSIVADITRANRHRQDNSLNRTLQNFMYNVMTREGQMISGDDVHSVAAFKSLQVIIELYRRRVWYDPRTVNIVALAAVDRSNVKMMQLALNFFLGKIAKVEY